MKSKVHFAKSGGMQMCWTAINFIAQRNCKKREEVIILYKFLFIVQCMATHIYWFSFALCMMGQSLWKW